ncbi:Zn-dependent hydrolase, partial [Salmonella enterica subsp. enterica serovar Typhimurium]|uniref:peptidase dimerization domain-containing protein n=1 Tax=Salmonella enterica TaxID=28901 RepID=UPI000CC87850
QFSDTAVATVGELNVYPNGANVIPGQVSLTVDVRDITEAQRAKLVEAIKQKSEKLPTNIR